MRRKKTDTVPTQHAMLVAWGEYAQAIGLIDAINQVKLHQKTRTHSPQRKLLEALVGTLAGLPYLQDISRSAHPLDQDMAVARAWGQSGWADYSGISRTLQTLDMDEAQAIIQGLQKVSQVFIDAEVTASLAQEGRILLDGDLTGLPVCKSSRSYPDVAYGHMDDQIQLGYQAAVVSMRSPTYGRLWLSIAHHPGNALSSQQAQALMLAAEASTQRRPWRRTDLLSTRLAQAEQADQQLAARLGRQQAKMAQAQAQIAQTEQLLQHLQAQIAQLEQQYQAAQRPERPTSKLALTRKRLLSYQKRLKRQQIALAKADQLQQRTQQRLAHQQAHTQKLAVRLVRFEQENADNRHPLQAAFRLDAGFGTWDNLALLIEMGYEVFTKAYSSQTVRVLHQQLDQTQDWVAVGPRAQMLGCEQVLPHNFCYPIDVGLLRFATQEDSPKHAAMLHFGPTPVTADVQQWFDFFNCRQTIEAGIKESKRVFYLHHFKVRSTAAIVLQEHFVLFAANFIRWANAWLMNHSSGCAKAILDHTKMGTKRLVHVGAHLSAEVSWFSEGCLLRFSDLSLLAGRQLLLPNHKHRARAHPEKLAFFRPFSCFAKWLHNP